MGVDNIRSIKVVITIKSYNITSLKPADYFAFSMACLIED
jgi:hypothetical protein